MRSHAVRGIEAIESKLLIASLPASCEDGIASGEAGASSPLDARAAAAPSTLTSDPHLRNALAPSSVPTRRSCRAGRTGCRARAHPRPWVMFGPTSRRRAPTSRRIGDRPQPAVRRAGQSARPRIAWLAPFPLLEQDAACPATMPRKPPFGRQWQERHAPAANRGGDGDAADGATLT